MNVDELENTDEFGVPVHVFFKSDREQIRISLNEYKGYEYIDIRIFYRSYEGFRPSPKGITLRKELLPELVRGIAQLSQIVGLSEDDILD